MCDCFHVESRTSKLSYDAHGIALAGASQVVTMMLMKTTTETTAKLLAERAQIRKLFNAWRSAKGYTSRECQLNMVTHDGRLFVSVSVDSAREPETEFALLEESAANAIEFLSAVWTREGSDER